MDESVPSPRRPRWFQFGVGSLLLLLTVVALGLAARPRSRIPMPPPMPVTVDDVNDLVAAIQGPKRKVGFIEDIRVPAANRLGEIGELARANGAVEALEKLAATTNDPKVAGRRGTGRGEAKTRAMVVAAALTPATPWTSDSFRVCGTVAQPRIRVRHCLILIDA